MTTSVNASAVDLRPAGLGDAAVMAKIHAACFARSWDAASIGDLLTTPGCLSLLVGAQGVPAQAFLMARAAGDEAELLTLAVHPSRRRIGLARALLLAAASTLRSAGARHLFLEVEETNAPARSLYRSLGAVEVGNRPRYYEHGADAAIFSLAL